MYYLFVVCCCIPYPIHVSVFDVLFASDAHRHTVTMRGWLTVTFIPILFGLNRLPMCTFSFRHMIGWLFALMRLWPCHWVDVYRVEHQLYTYTQAWLSRVVHSPAATISKANTAFLMSAWKCSPQLWRSSIETGVYMHSYLHAGQQRYPSFSSWGGNNCSLQVWLDE